MQVNTKENQCDRETLPRSIVPVHYSLYLEPDLTRFIYTGRVKIDIEVIESTNTITLNSNLLTIKSASVDSIDASRIEENKEKFQLNLTYDNHFKAGTKLALCIDFEGEINDQMCGFYRSIYKNEEGEDSVVATTQMEATECRRAFPCFDEPALKATFDISIAADIKYTVLSNSDVKNTEINEKSGKTITHFNTTPKMSTYLVAFVIGELEYVESDLFRLPVRVYTPLGLKSGCQYAADLAAKTLAFFEKTFDIAYPLPKCDMIGLHDFAAGAMENWGLITYRLVALVYDENTDSQEAKFEVTETVQHELAHQWFGNLVTMEWWEGLWLNEGFATWMSWYACNHFYPEWKVWEKYITDSYQQCLAMDALESTHAVEVPVQRAQDVDEIFDAISYLKGACVIRMISTLLGEDTFIRGISHYLKTFSYSNTVTTDLWDALSEVSGVNVGEVMGSWTRTPGYPLLVVNESENPNEIEVSQHRFFGSVPRDSDQLYPVSLEIRNSDGKVNSSQILKDQRGTFKVSDSKFFKLNADQSGIFRVKYNDSILKRIAIEGTKGEDSLLTTGDKLGLLGDLQALKGTYIPTGQLLTIAQEWRSDPSPLIIIKMLRILSDIAGILSLQDESSRGPFRTFRESFMVPLADKYGHDFTEAKDPLVDELKSNLFSATIAVESPKYVKIALNSFSEKKFDVPADIRFPILRTVAKYGTPEQWDELKQHYLQSNNPESSQTALMALGFTEDPTKAKELLSDILNERIRMQDSAGALSGLVYNVHMCDISWNWFTENWETIEKRFPVSGRILGNIIAVVVTGIVSKQHLERVDAFFDGKELPGNERLYATAHDALESKVAVIDKTVTQVLSWLKTENKL